MAGLLANDDPAIRSTALATVQAIGHELSVDVLEGAAMASDPVVASQSTLLLRSRSVDPAARLALDRVAQEHWYPTVRAIAAGSTQELRESEGLSVRMFFEGAEPSRRMAANCPGEGTPSVVRDEWPPAIAEGADLAAARLAIVTEHDLHIDSALELGAGDWLLLTRMPSPVQYFKHGARHPIASPDWPSGAELAAFRYRGVDYLVATAARTPLNSAALYAVMPVSGTLRFSTVMLLPAFPDEIRSDGSERLLFVSSSVGVIDLSQPAAPRWLGCAPETPGHG